MGTGCTGERLRQKVGRQMMLLSFKVLISDEEREGKSYGGSHRGNQGVVPPAVGLGVGHQGYRMVKGNTGITYMYTLR